MYSISLVLLCCQRSRPLFARHARNAAESTGARHRNLKELISVHRSDWIVIGVVTGLNAVAFIAIAITTLLAGPEWLEFVIVLAMVVVTLLGAYWVLFAPEDMPKERSGGDRSE